jgi:hypothetical protein
VSIPTREQQAEGDRLAVGAFTGMSSFDPLAARKVLEDATADEMREAIISLAGVMCGMVMAQARQQGIPERAALDDAAAIFGALARLRTH